MSPRPAEAERVARLEERVAELEREVQELRSINLRLAEITDVVQELLIPLHRRDQAGVDEAIARFTQSLG